MTATSPCRNKLLKRFSARDQSDVEQSDVGIRGTGIHRKAQHPPEAFFPPSTTIFKYLLDV